MELIKDKVVIVTGAAAGIGAGVAKLFSLMVLALKT
jgi:NADP-dependent 3-hydroxy acid dehydrogenase YdfG